MIQCGEELIRICPTDSMRLEYSTNGGKLWIPRYHGSKSIGRFLNLMENGKELLATTSQGLCYSTNKGRLWVLRRH